jgi:hypothetical protein
MVGMKTTVELSDDLYRRAKAEAAMTGRKFKDLVEEGLRTVLEAPRETAQRPANLTKLLKRARGMIASGISDLSTNPKHMEGFGRDGRRHR